MSCWGQLSLQKTFFDNSQHCNFFLGGIPNKIPHKKSRNSIDPSKLLGTKMAIFCIFSSVLLINNVDWETVFVANLEWQTKDVNKFFIRNNQLRWECVFYQVRKSSTARKLVTFIRKFSKSHLDIHSDIHDSLYLNEQKKRWQREDIKSVRFQNAYFSISLALSHSLSLSLSLSLSRACFSDKQHD